MKILVTAGPTQEAIDPVRYLSNHSSGKMGYAVAEAAVAAGHEVVLVSGPVALAAPEGVRFVSVITAEEMYVAVEKNLAGCDCAIMAAAVADYRPKRVASGKLKKSEGEMTLVLERTRDILGSARTVMGFEGILVGFAAETSLVREYAKGKLERKRCDLMAANDVSRPGLGFGSDENSLLLLYADGREEDLGQATKLELGKRLVAAVERL